MMLPVPVRRSAVALSMMFALTLVQTPVNAYDLEKAAKTFGETNMHPPQPVQVLRGWEGGDSAITDMPYERVVDQERWTDVWQKHAPGVAPPPVDFTREMVVAIFGGMVGSNIPRISLHSVTESDVIEVTTMNFFNDILSKETANLYLLTVLPLSRKPVVVVGRNYAFMRNPQLQYRVIGEIKELRR